MAPLALALPWAIPAGSSIAWGTTAMMYGTALGAAGAVQSGRAAQAQGESLENTSNYNAAIQEREAKAIEQKTKFDQIRHAERAARIKSSLRAKLAGSGARMDVGAPLMLQEEQAAELELENMLIGYEGQIGAGRARSQAEIDRLQGKLYSQKGKAAARAGYIGAGATLLTGFGTAGLYGGGGGLKSAGSKVGSWGAGSTGRYTQNF